jgi:hypothetical protein
LKKEPFNSSIEKAKTLTIASFGTYEEVMDMAKPLRLVNSRTEAKKALEDIITANGTVEQSAIELKSKSGMSAMLRRSSIGKLVSGVQEGEMPKEALWLAAANIDKLFENAIEPWRFELNQNKNNDGIRDRRILFSPMEFDKKIIPVKITVKKYLDPLAEAKIYSVEAINIDLDKNKEDVGTLTAISLK